ncbi:MAG: Electron transfer flavoprotein subunit alpha [Phycisphaerae bacterium]|nr:Electron transfer flavoprotein subunit alpha [Phycisphaerae bacterium]
MIILIFAEQRQGHRHGAVTQLFTAAQAISADAEIHVALLGHQLNPVAAELQKYPAAKIYGVDHAELELYRPQPYVQALDAVLKQSKPHLVLLPASFMGRDLAPRLAARTGAALATDCIAFTPQGDSLIVTRPVYAGKATAQLKLAADRLKICSVRPNTFAAAAPTSGNSAVEKITVNFDAATLRLKNNQWASTSSGVKDVTEADIVVSGGRSLKNADNFKILYELAAVLDAAVGASRAACDAGYQPHSRQVGLTGKTVTPKLYLAFGIDGAIQHLAGMRGSKCIVAINTKKEAPIYNVADYGCVADLFTMAPLLKSEFQNLLGK